MEKHCSNLQYFKEKKLQNKIFNQLNIKKVKLTKKNLKKNEKKREKEKKKKCEKNKVKKRTKK
jgi:hypothetical protein